MEINKRCLITLLLFSFPIASLSLVNNGFRAELSHVDSNSNFAQTELLYRAATRTMHRLSQFKRMKLFSSSNISTTLHYNVPLGEFMMNLTIGTPPLHYSAIADTGTDLIWTQCAPCQNCVSQPTPLYNPTDSTTASSIPCNSTIYRSLCSDQNPPPSCLCSYNITYGEGWTSGALDKETFIFGTTRSVSVPNVTFGCSTSTSDILNGSAGIVGLGKGKLSLTSQLKARMFSYCLSSFLDTNSTSPLFIGPLSKFSGTGVKSTPFVKNPSVYPLNTYYYLSVQGISLGSNNLAIQSSTFALQSNGTGGLIIDSGTPFTSLVNEAYLDLKNATGSIVNLSRADGSKFGLDLCYFVPSGSSLPTMPDLTFHFDGADMVMPVDNYMILFRDQNLWCLAIFGSDLGLSILGSFQQQNLHILYDVDKEFLSFAPANCANI